jgi:predicted transcriptional regulator
MLKECMMKGRIMELGLIMASSCRQNILRVLYHKHKIGLTKLVEETNSTYNELMRNIHILEAEGIVKLVRYGRRCNVVLMDETFRTKVLIEALRLLDSKPDKRRQPVA